MTSTLAAATDRPVKRVGFGARVQVRAFAEPWIGHQIAAGAHYYPARRPLSHIVLALSRRQHADDGQLDTWPGFPLPGSDTPWPGAHEAHLRYRRLILDPTPIRAVVLRTVTRGEGPHVARRLRPVRTVRLVEVALQPPHRPRFALVCPSDLISGWGKP